MKYPKQTLTPVTKVTSESLDKNEQNYKINYLEKTKDFMDKVRIYFYDRPVDKCTPRSISFLNPEELLDFIKEQIIAYMFLKEQRVRPELQIALSVYRTDIMLKDLLKDIKEDVLNNWKNNK